jgi:RHS repeat-associated protein
VERTTALGRKFTYLVERISTGGRRRVTTCACGAQTAMLQSTDASRTLTYPEGVTAIQEEQPDPRFGMIAPLLKKAIFKTPGGLEATIAATREAPLSDPDNPLSLTDLTDTVDSNGRTGTTTFHANQKQIIYNTPEGRQKIVTLDAMGRVLNARIEGLEPIAFAYDTRGRLTTVVRGTQTFTHTFDTQGRLNAISDADGNQLQYDYDDVGRLTGVTLPSGRICRFAYDANGNITRINMPRGDVHTLGYTAVNLGAHYTPPGNGSYNISYNQDRQPTRVILPGGRTIDNNYDSCGRLERKSYPEARIDFTYDDGAEQITEIARTPTDGGEAQRLTFTHDGELVTEMAANGAASGRYSYSYDNNLFHIGIRLDEEPETTLVRDGDGLLTGLGPFTIIRERPDGAPTQIKDGSLTIDVEYDSFGRVASRTHIVDGHQFYQARFTYDIIGRIVRNAEMVDGSGAIYDYNYDKDGQLTEVKRDGSVVERYACDANGNRTSRQVGENPAETASYDAQDRILQQGPAIYQFNSDGFLVQRGGDTFQYSARGELLEAILANGEKISYTYDGLSRHVARTDTSGTRQYLYGNPDDPVQITAVRDPSGVLSEYYYDEAGLLFAIRRGGAFHYVATNQVGTPRAVCNAEGQVVKILDGDSFGNLTTDTNPGFDLPIGFAGGLADTATGLERFGFRDYDPAAGRWTARDPLLFAGGQTNLYLYVGNNPINRRDPNGLDGGIFDIEGHMIDLVDAGGVDKFSGKLDQLVPGAGPLLKGRVAIDDYLDVYGVLKDIYKAAKGVEAFQFPLALFATKIGEFWGDIIKDLFKRLGDCLDSI